MKYNILFVCTANICRSPLAQGIFNHRCQQLGIDNQMVADSAGTEVWRVGARPDKRSLNIAAQHGILLPGWSRKFMLKDFERFDLILAMDHDNFRNLTRMGGPGYEGKIKMVRDFDIPEYAGTGVPDPYFSSKNGFQEVFSILHTCCENLIRTLRTELR